MSKKTQRREFKTLPLELKEVKQIDDDEGVKTGVIIGYAAIFNNIDFGNDRIKPGAFKKTIREKKGHWPILADHNPTKMIGINDVAKEDVTGLLTESKINLEVEKGREKFALARQAMEMGVPLGLSIGYRALKYDFENDKKVGMIRNIQEIKMYEHSIVTFPMNEEAFITDAKSLETADIKGHLIGFVERLKKCGHSTDDIKELIIEALKDRSNNMIEPDSLVHSIDKVIKILKGK